MAVQKTVHFCWMLVLSGLLQAAVYQRVCIPQSCSETAKSAAKILTRKMNLSADAIVTVSDSTVPIEGEILLAVLPLKSPQAQWAGSAANKIKNDGYVIVFRSDSALICGAGPRSFLYAAADWRLWKDKTEGTFVREPSFAIRAAVYDSSIPVDECVATLGVNVLIDYRVDADKVKACHNADIACYAFLYGNNFQLWSPSQYEAAIKANPSIQGTPAVSSWEQATLCPSDPNSWKLIEGYVKEFLERSGADGLYATFWDNYGIYCQCDRCKKNGLNQFSNQLFECVKHYYQVTSAMDKKLIIRTWSSGVPHWLGEKWVHAPGYDNFGGSGVDLWGRVIQELPKDIILQTKVYHADCQPDARFSMLLGKASGHTEIAEYQIIGQTTGLFYFPASTVNHTVWTMKKSYDLVSPQGGVCLFWGGARQRNYLLLSDIINSINVYAWREVSWNVNVDMERVWKDWATPIYGSKAAPHIINAMQLSEDAVNKTFSTLGMGSDTNSGFARTIARRETLLMYTNRYFLPEYAKYLEPNKDNIQQVIDEKNECLKKIDAMFSELEAAKPDLTKPQAEELATRFEWLKEFSIVSRYLDESLWRYRYLRHLSEMRMTEPEQIKYLAQAYDAVWEHQKKLFHYLPDQRFSCYSMPLGQLRARPSLGDPMPLMKELYESSKACVEQIVGPDVLPVEWKR